MNKRQQLKLQRLIEKVEKKLWNSRLQCPNCGLRANVAKALNWVMRPAKAIPRRWLCVAHPGDSPVGCGFVWDVEEKRE